MELSDTTEWVLRLDETSSSIDESESTETDLKVHHLDEHDDDDTRSDCIVNRPVVVDEQQLHQHDRQQHQHDKDPLNSTANMANDVAAATPGMTAESNELEHHQHDVEIITIRHNIDRKSETERDSSGSASGLHDPLHGHGHDDDCDVDRICTACRPTVDGRLNTITGKR